MARLQPPQELDIKNGAVYTKVHLQRGRTFGPYILNWTEDPQDKQLAWEVSLIIIYILLQVKGQMKQ